MTISRRVANGVPATLAMAVLAGWLALSAMTPAASAQGIERTPSTEGAHVYIISPLAGESVTSPVTVRFGLSGMGIAPAGIVMPGTGHHHLLIDQELPPLDQPVPASDTYLHFGAGQTETVLELPPGEHTLQLLLADHNHIPHDPPVISEPVTFTVE